MAGVHTGHLVFVDIRQRKQAIAEDVTIAVVVVLRGDNLRRGMLGVLDQGTLMDNHKVQISGTGSLGVTALALAVFAGQLLDGRVEAALAAPSQCRRNHSGLHGSWWCPCPLLPGAVPG